MAENIKKIKNQGVLKRIVSLSLLYPSVFIAHILMMIISTGVNILGYELLKKTLDVLVAGNKASFYMLLIPLALVSFALAPLIGIVTGRLSFRYIQKTTIALWKKMNNKILSLTPGAKEKYGDAELVSRYSNDLNKLINFCANDFSRIMINIVIFLATLFYMIYSNLYLGLAMAVFSPLVSLISKKIFKPIEKVSLLHNEMISRENSVFLNAIEGSRQIKSYNANDWIHDRYAVAAEKRTKAGIRLSNLINTIGMLSNDLSLMPMFFCFLFGGYMVFWKILSFGELMVISMLLNDLVPSLFAVSGSFSAYYDAKASALRVFDLFDAPEEKQGSAAEIKYPVKAAPGMATPGMATPEDTTPGMATPGVATPGVAVCFNNLTFAYNEDKTPVLKSVNFSINKGEIVAVVGKSGSGKSTLCRLIAGFYTHYKGNLRVFGEEVSRWNIKALREKITLVRQGGGVFSGMLFENVRMARPDATDEQVKKALDSASLVKTENLPDCIANRGTNISGGQRQRIMLARSFLKNSEIVILDEPTSAIDPLNEEKIYSSLIHEKKPGQTIIVITHRLESIKIFPRIIAVRNGEVSELGTYKDLDENYKNIFSEGAES